MKLRTIKEANVTNKRVLVRVDYNVSLDEKNNVTDDTRITQTLPTIKFLVNRKAKVIIASHLGRPGGKSNPKYSLKSVADILGGYLGQKITLFDSFWEQSVLDKIKKVNPGQVVMLENIRFHPGETANDQQFARRLGSLADVFVNDAFGTAHRVHASVVGVTNFLPAYAGLLLDQEISLITSTLNSSTGQLAIVIGGAKTPEKIRVIDSLLNRADSILLGGAVANTFLSMWGIPTGCSLVDYEMIEMARQVIWEATQTNSSLLLPEDVVVSNKQRTRQPKILNYQEVPGHLAIFDIGPKTIKSYKRKITASDRVIWNGPMGLFEDERFARGTEEILQALCKHKGTTIIGGGDTLTAIKDKTVLDKITHISTGGGALLEFLEKETIPGVEIVKK